MVFTIEGVDVGPRVDVDRATAERMLGPLVVDVRTLRGGIASGELLRRCGSFVLQVHREARARRRGVLSEEEESLVRQWRHLSIVALKAQRGTVRLTER